MTLYCGKCIVCLREFAQMWMYAKFSCMMITRVCSLSVTDRFFSDVDTWHDLQLLIWAWLVHAGVWASRETRFEPENNSTSKMSTCLHWLRGWLCVVISVPLSSSVCSNDHNVPLLHWSSSCSNGHCLYVLLTTMYLCFIARLCSVVIAYNMFMFYWPPCCSVCSTDHHVALYVLLTTMFLCMFYWPPCCSVCSTDHHVVLYVLTLTTMLLCMFYWPPCSSVCSNDHHVPLYVLMTTMFLCMF